MTDKKTIGTILKSKRISLGITLDQVEKELRIKKNYLVSLEEDHFEDFDSPIIVKGFLQNYSKLLSINPEIVLALYRRDYENKDMKRKIKIIEEAPEVTEPKYKLPEFNITRRKVIMFSLFLLFTFFSVIIFRTLQKTFSHPSLEIYAPFEIAGEYEGRISYDEDDIVIKGKISSGNSLIINQEVIPVNSDFTFESNPIPTIEKENIIVIETENSLGSKTEMKVTLYKTEKQIRVMDMIMNIPRNNISLLIKSDDIVRFEGLANNGQIIEISANTKLEIATSDFLELRPIINGEEYVLRSQNTIFENSGSDIFQK